MHGRPARAVLHLEDIAGTGHAGADDLLRIVAEEDRIQAVGTALFPVFLRHFVIHVCHGGLGIVDELETDPRLLVSIDRLQRPLEDGQIARIHLARYAGGAFGGDIRIPLRRPFGKAGEILLGKHRFLPLLQGLDDVLYRLPAHRKPPSARPAYPTGVQT